ncbi:MAG: FeoA domain-containing protein [Planctomycetales bacterium]|nr:FeoA domain-containing protein [Planctomycetales bacterium]
MADLVPLSLISVGRQEEVSQIVGPADEARRLEELGIRRGTRVEVVQHGTPCIVRIGASRLCFRSNDTLNVLVREQLG